MAKWSKWLEEEEEVTPKTFEKIKSNKDKPIIDRTNHKKKNSKRIEKPEKS